LSSQRNWKIQITSASSNGARHNGEPFGVYQGHRHLAVIEGPRICSTGTGNRKRATCTSRTQVLASCPHPGQRSRRLKIGSPAPLISQVFPSLFIVAAAVMVLLLTLGMVLLYGGSQTWRKSFKWPTGTTTTGSSSTLPPTDTQPATTSLSASPVLLQPSRLISSEPAATSLNCKSNPRKHFWPQQNPPTSTPSRVSAESAQKKNGQRCRRQKRAVEIRSAIKRRTRPG